jgi:hypothetical protein
MKEGVLISLLLLQQITEVNKLKKAKGLFWPSVLNIFVHDRLAPLLFTVHHCGCLWWRRPIYLTVVGCGKERDQGPTVPFQGTPPDDFKLSIISTF